LAAAVATHPMRANATGDCFYGMEHTLVAPARDTVQDSDPR
jgi:hypothetical protein